MKKIKIDGFEYEFEGEIEGIITETKDRINFILKPKRGER